MSDRFLRRPEVEQEVGLKKSAIYDYMAKGTFPNFPECWEIHVTKNLVGFGVKRARPKASWVPYNPFGSGEIL